MYSQTIVLVHLCHCQKRFFAKLTALLTGWWLVTIVHFVWLQANAMLWIFYTDGYVSVYRFAFYWMIYIYYSTKQSGSAVWALQWVQQAFCYCTREHQHKTEHFSNFPVMSVCSFAVSIAQHAAPNWNMGSHSQWIRAVLDIVCICPKVSYNVFCYETPLEHCIKRAFIFFPEAANSAHSWITVILMLDPTETLYGCLQ